MLIFAFILCPLQLHAKKKSKEDLIEKYKRIDSDGDGKITIKEIIEWGKRKGIKTEEAAKKKHAQWDADGDGSITQEEFLKAFESKK